MHLAFMASFYVAMHRKLCTLCHVNTPTWTYTNSWNIITGPGGWPRTVEQLIKLKDALQCQ